MLTCFGHSGSDLRTIVGLSGLDRLPHWLGNFAGRGECQRPELAPRVVSVLLQRIVWALTPDINSLTIQSLALPVSLLHKAGSEFRPKPSVQNRRRTRGANTLPWCQLLHTLPLWHWYRKWKVFCLKGHTPLCSARVCLFHTWHPLACVTLKVECENRQREKPGKVSVSASD